MDNTFQGGVWGGRSPSGGSLMVRRVCSAVCAWRAPRCAARRMLSTRARALLAL
jgi:hypothetical protein